MIGDISYCLIYRNFEKQVFSSRLSLRSLTEDIDFQRDRQVVRMAPAGIAGGQGKAGGGARAGGSDLNAKCFRALRVSIDGISNVLKNRTSVPTWKESRNTFLTQPKGRRSSSAFYSSELFVL